MDRQFNNLARSIELLIPHCLQRQHELIIHIYVWVADMKDGKRIRKKDKQAPIGPIQPHGPLSNGVGQTPNQAGNAALVRDQAKLKLDPDDRRVFDHLEQGYGIDEIALSLRQTIDWVEQRKKHISVVLGMVLVELHITL